MSELTERAWKHRFSERLAWGFIVGGATVTNALEDAFAHADHQYQLRGIATPELEADSILTSLEEVPKA